jgi:hypothetical protein
VNPTEHPLHNVGVEAERSLARCRESKNAIACLESLTARLLIDGWHQGEVREIERIVLSALGENSTK